MSSHIFLQLATTTAAVCHSPVFSVSTENSRRNMHILSHSATRFQVCYSNLFGTRRVTKIDDLNYAPRKAPGHLLLIRPIQFLAPIPQHSTQVCVWEGESVTPHQEQRKKAYHTKTREVKHGNRALSPHFCGTRYNQHGGSIQDTKHQNQP